MPEETNNKHKRQNIIHNKNYFSEKVTDDCEIAKKHVNPMGGFSSLLSTPSYHFQRNKPGVNFHPICIKHLEHNKICH